MRLACFQYIFLVRRDASWAWTHQWVFLAMLANAMFLSFKKRAEKLSFKLAKDAISGRCST